MDRWTSTQIRQGSIRGSDEAVVDETTTLATDHPELAARSRGRGAAALVPGAGRVVDLSNDEQTLARRLMRRYRDDWGCADKLDCVLAFHSGGANAELTSVEAYRRA